jgi:hypothetical protein
MPDITIRFYLVMSCLNDKPMNRPARMMLTDQSSHTVIISQISKSCKALRIDDGWSTIMQMVNN